MGMRNRYAMQEYGGMFVRSWRAFRRWRRLHLVLGVVWEWRRVEGFTLVCQAARLSVKIRRWRYPPWRVTLVGARARIPK